MKTIVLFLFTALLAMQLHAQIVLNTDDLPSVGDIQVSVKVDSLQAVTLLPGDAGTQIVWNFSDLLPCCEGLQFSYDTLTWIHPADTPYEFDFPLSNLALKGNCYLLHSHETHLDEEFCNYSYFIKNNEGVLLNGNYKNNTQVYDKMRFIFPLMQYGETFQDDARIAYYTSNDTVKVYYFQNISVADGWGTVITPVDTVDAIRVYTTEIIFDSLYVNNIGNQLSKTTGNYYYHWFIKGLGYPVMQIFRGSLHQENTYFQEVKYAVGKTNYLSTPELVQGNPIKLINERGSNTVTFIFPDNISGQQYFIDFFDLTGRKINPFITFFNNSIVSSLDNYPVGVYLYRIGNATRILKTGKISVH